MTSNTPPDLHILCTYVHVGRGVSEGAAEPSRMRKAKLGAASSGSHGGRNAYGGVTAGGGYTTKSYLHRHVVAYTGLTTAAVVNEPFLAVDDTAFGREHRSHAGSPSTRAQDQVAPHRVVLGSRPQNRC